MAALNNQSRRKHCVILFLRCKTEVTPLRLPGQPNRGIRCFCRLSALIGYVTGLSCAKQLIADCFNRLSAFLGYATRRS